jgi:type II secretory pathway pseudopilin PulG
VSGRDLAGALVAIALLTFVMPPLLARQVAAARVARATEEAGRIAKLAAEDDGRATGVELRASRLSPLVLVGPGASPKFAEATGWPEQRAPSALFAQPDPWGNHYLVVMPEGDNHAIVVSAGPNGVVETPFAATRAGQATGDDIVAFRRPG